jgi:integrase/recombinase XerD
LLRFEFSQGALPHRLHEQIDTPRVYLGERLPRALPWEQVRCLLRSIDRSTPQGGRDFTMMYLAAAYGLRGGELVRLCLEDIDWRKGTLRVPQAKTRQVLALPLTDEAGDVLARYLRQSRPATEYRQLFLHARAPSAPLGPSAVTAIVQRRLRLSGLKVEHFSAHVLRHSLAVHLLRRGVSTKAIGDTLGHRDVTSTAVYLRLGLEDLRKVGLPVPKPRRAAHLLEPGWRARFPRVRGQTGGPPRVRHRFRSLSGQAMRHYLDHRRTLGRKYVTEASTLRAWDKFLQRRGARTVSRELFDRWAKSLSDLNPTVQRKRLCIVRNFLRYDARAHPGRFVPDLESFPKTLPPKPPRLVSPSEMARVLATAARLRRSHHNPLRAQTVRLGLLLLFCCGLRAGELLRLQRQHYDASEQLLRLQGTKFHKSRLVPLSPSVAREITHYLEQCRRHGLTLQPDSPLVWSGARREPKASYSSSGLTTTWKHLCLSAGVLDRRGRPPRLHDLRHSFAVAALHRWYEQGVNAQARLPHLATYLGHVNPASSHYYLQFTPALRTAASQRFHRAFGRLLAKGGAA